MVSLPGTACDIVRRVAGGWSGNTVTSEVSPGFAAILERLQASILLPVQIGEKRRKTWVVTVLPVEGVDHGGRPRKHARGALVPPPAEPGRLLNCNSIGREKSARGGGCGCGGWGLEHRSRPPPARPGRASQRLNCGRALRREAAVPVPGRFRD